MLKTFNNDADSSEIVEALRRDGGAIVARQAPDELIDTIKSELRPHFDTEGQSSAKHMTRIELISTLSWT